MNFTLTAFGGRINRNVVIHGTKGTIRGSMHDDQYSVHTFIDNDTKTYKVKPFEINGSAHAGGDVGLIKAWLTSIGAKDKTLLRSDIMQSNYSHQLVFLIEQARHEQKVINVQLPHQKTLKRRTKL